MASQIGSGSKRNIADSQRAGVVKIFQCIVCGSSFRVSNWSSIILWQRGWQCRNKECGFQWEEDENGLYGYWCDDGTNTNTGIYVAVPGGCLPVVKEENP